MRYEKSLTEVLQWKKEASNVLYDLTIQERLQLIKAGAKIRLLRTKSEKKPDQILPQSERRFRQIPRPGELSH